MVVAGSLILGHKEEFYSPGHPCFGFSLFGKPAREDLKSQTCH